MSQQEIVALVVAQPSDGNRPIRGKGVFAFWHIASPELA